MRVSGRKLRLAVGTGITVLMLTLGVSSVGATAPSATGGIVAIVTGKAASAYHSTNPGTTVATFRNAVVVSSGDLDGLDDCRYTEVGKVSNATTVSSKDVDGCGALTLQPAAYPLWLVVGGPGVSSNGKYLVVPETEVPKNGTVPAKTYIIDNFR
ncbi:MAG: hypothetical protein ACR2JW_10135 [Thermomicrobiales bacterium]